MQLVYGEANSEWAVAWLTRLPLLRSTNHRLPVLAKTLVEVEVDWNGDPLVLFATHLVHGRHEAAAEVRLEEARAIVEVVSQCEAPHALVGDFNAVSPLDAIGVPPPEEALEFVARKPVEEILATGYVDCYRRLHDEPGSTYLSWHPWARIDFVFASHALASRLRECDVVTDGAAMRASDHFPVRAEFG
jgi:exodeoxyribonuclease III